jgi:flagellar assembly protein FliH
MIIKGKRDPNPSDDEPKPVAAPPREPASNIIKAAPGVQILPRPQVPKKGTVLKRGQYSMAPDEPPPAAEPEPTPVAEDMADAAAAAALPVPTGEPAAVNNAGPMVAGATFPTAAAAPAPAPVPTGPPVDQQIIEEAKRRAEAIMRQAQMDAKKLLEESKVYCQQALQQAEQEGFELGKRKGVDAAEKEYAEHIYQARLLLAQISQAREHVMRAAQPEIARLAMHIAERITATAVSTNPDVIKNQVTEALEKVKDREQITVRVNPQDLEVARNRREVFQKMLENCKTFEIAGDSKVDRGGCLIETNLGNVDARVATQLTALQQAFEVITKREEEEAATAAVLHGRELELQAAAERDQTLAQPVPQGDVHPSVEPQASHDEPPPQPAVEAPAPEPAPDMSFGLPPEGGAA